MTEKKYTNAEIQLAIDYSHNYATARPDTPEIVKEHILGLCLRLQSLLVERNDCGHDNRSPAQAAQVDAVNRGVQAERDVAVAALVDISEYALPPDDASEREFTADGHKWCMQRAYKGMEDCDAARAAEPVAQDEVVATLGKFIGCGGKGFAVMFSREDAKRLGALPEGTKLYAAQPRAVPDGWVLVPKAVSDEMIQAFSDVAWVNPHKMICDFRDGYKAMLAAAPSPGDH